MISKNKVNGKYESAVSDLTRYLYEYYGEKVVVLIDEYDTPLINARGYKHYDEVLSFFKSFYGDALKTNQYLEQGILTGLSTYYLRALDSSVNNAVTYDITKNRYDQYFGFTTEEVKQILKDYNLQDKEKEVRDWYGKYIFGSKELYNPFSVLSYIKYKEFDKYWVNTSGNSLIEELLRKYESEEVDQLNQLINGNKVSAFITPEVTLDNSFNENDLWKFLLFAGYLKISYKVTSDYYYLEIPNKEVKNMFKKNVC